MTAKRRRALSTVTFFMVFILSGVPSLAWTETQATSPTAEAEASAPLFRAFLPVPLAFSLALRSPDAAQTFMPGSNSFAQGSSARSTAVGARIALDDDTMGVIKFTSIRGGSGRAQPRIFTPRTTFDKPAVKVIQAGLTFSF